MFHSPVGFGPLLYGGLGHDRLQSLGVAQSRTCLTLRTRAGPVGYQPDICCLRTRHRVPSLCPSCRERVSAVAVSVMQPLSAPIELQFDYTRSVGPTIGRFMTGLAEGHVVGVRVSDGRVFVPPVEYDPSTGSAVTDFVSVADEGVVVSWTWAPHPLPGQPLSTPFAWVLVRLDGADTAILRTALDVARGRMRCRQRRDAGSRVRWARDRASGRLATSVCFEPG